MLHQSVFKFPLAIAGVEWMNWTLFGVLAMGSAAMMILKVHYHRSDHERPT